MVNQKTKRGSTAGAKPGAQAVRPGAGRKQQVRSDVTPPGQTRPLSGLLQPNDSNRPAPVVPPEISAQNGASIRVPIPGPSLAADRPELDLTEKIKQLVRLAQEQGYLTYTDINDTLPDEVITPEELDEIYLKLRNLEVEITDQAEVDNLKPPEQEEEEDRGCSWTFWTIRSGCISSKWARCRC